MFQATGMKMFGNVSTNTPNVLRGNCGMHMCNYILVQITANETIIVSCQSIYKMMLRDIEKRSNWAFQLQEFLLTYDFESVQVAHEEQDEPTL